MQRESDSFLLKCRDLYHAGITPANPEQRTTEEYQTMVELGLSYFKEGREREFSGFFGEAQYAVDLWAAHLILEHGKPDHILKQSCIEIIRRYAGSTMPHARQIAMEEIEWLAQNQFNNKL